MSTCCLTERLGLSTLDPTCAICGAVLGEMCRGPSEAVAKLADARDRLAAENARLRQALSGLVGAVDNLIADSSGVYGLHLNGDEAPWTELTEGGRFEDWLLPLAAARALLEKPDA